MAIESPSLIPIRRLRLGCHKTPLLNDTIALGAEHPSTVVGLNNLALLYSAQGKYAQAERLYERALLIRN
jgi:tetratricopeptide (TPR) repeat protein